MEIKDYISLSLGAAAFILSIFATINSNIKARETKNRSIRDLLTNTLDKLTSLQLDIIKLKNTSPQDNKFLFEIDSLAKQKNGFLLEQATFLAKEIPSLVHMYEVNTIAYCNLISGNSKQAEEFYLLAIDKAITLEEKAGSISSYAFLLYQINRVAEGRTSIDKAIDLIVGDDNLSKQTRGNISRTGAMCELNFAHNTKYAKNYAIRALKEYSAIDIVQIKTERLATMAELQQMLNL